MGETQPIAKLNKAIRDGVIVVIPTMDGGCDVFVDPKASPSERSDLIKAMKNASGNDDLSK